MVDLEDRRRHREGTILRTHFQATLAVGKLSGISALGVQGIKFDVIPPQAKVEFHKSVFLQTLRGSEYTLPIVVAFAYAQRHPKKIKEKISHSAVSNSLTPHGLQPTRPLHPWNFPGKNTRVGYHSLLKGIFPTKGSNTGLLHCRQILYHLGHQGSPKDTLMWCNKSPAPRIETLFTWT